MLLFLASDDEDRFEQVIKSKTESYERKRSEQEQQLEREDFLVHIWRKIYLKLLIERQEQEHNAAMHSHKEIKQLLTSIEIVSYKSHLLLAEVMMSLDYKGDYTIKIFRQLLLCSPANRTHIFVWLKIALRCSPLLKE